MRVLRHYVPVRNVRNVRNVAVWIRYGSRPLRMVPVRVRYGSRPFRYVQADILSFNRLQGNHYSSIKSRKQEKSFQAPSPVQRKPFYFTHAVLKISRKNNSVFIVCRPPRRIAAFSTDIMEVELTFNNAQGHTLDCTYFS